MSVLFQLEDIVSRLQVAVRQFAKGRLLQPYLWFK